MITIWKKKNKDGSPKVCKFCKQPVWWHTLEGRWYEPDGNTLHVTNCELRQQHFRDLAADTAQQQRNRRLSDL